MSMRKHGLPFYHHHHHHHHYCYFFFTAWCLFKRRYWALVENRAGAAGVNHGEGFDFDHASIRYLASAYERLVAMSCRLDMHNSFTVCCGDCLSSRRCAMM